MVNKIFKLIVKGFVWLLIIPVKFYQYSLSPLIPRSCRHEPTCSQYTIEALKIHGPLIGLYLGIHRFFRCHPWGTSGHDPVPAKGKWRKDKKE
jgi:putative membrane protein insertion efficiency factor